MPRRINPAHTAQRTGLRLIGGILAVAGGIFTASGPVSFFGAFGGSGAPELFWCAFVGLPLLGVGTALLKAGYMGTIARYESVVVGQRFAAMVGGTPMLLSAACPGGGTAGSEEPFALGSQNFAFTLTGGDPTAPLALLGLSAGGLAPIPCGCTFINALVTNAVPATNRGARFAFPLPCNVMLLGAELEYQWLLVGGAPSLCPAVPWLNASERVC